MLIQSKKGITLIELIIAMAIVGIVITIAFSLNQFGWKIEKKVYTASDIQFTTRLAASKIADICRNRTDLVVVDAVVPVDGCKYIRVKDYPGYSTISLISYPGGIETVLTRLDGGQFTLSFTPDGGMLKYTIKAEKGSDAYESSSGLQIVNMKSPITTQGTNPKLLRIGGSAVAAGPSLNMSGVGINVADKKITGTTSLMEYNIDGGMSGNSGTWFQASPGNTLNITFSPQTYVWVREKANPSNIHFVAYIDKRADAPNITISDMDHNNAVFMKDGSQITQNNIYEFTINGTTWISIISSTDIRTKNIDLNLKARVKVTATTLPSLETADLDTVD